MTVNQLFRELQKLKLDGHGEDLVLICDMTDEPPVPQVFDHAECLDHVNAVVLYSETVKQMIAKLNKAKQLEQMLAIAKGKRV